MSRIATISINFEAELAKARAQYESFKKEVENNPFRVPFTAGMGGGTTVGGLPVGPGQIPGAALGGGGFGGAASQTLIFQQFNQTLAQNLTQITNGVQQAAAQAAQAAGGASIAAVGGGGSGGGGAGSGSGSSLFGISNTGSYAGLLRRFGRAGGTFFAVREVGEVLREANRIRQRDRDEEFEGTEKAVHQDMEQTKSQSGDYLGFGRPLRSVAIPIIRGLGGNWAGRQLFGAGHEFQTDFEKEQQDRESSLRLESSDAIEKNRRFLISSSRHRATMNIDPISREQRESDFQLEDARIEAGRQRTRANFMMPFDSDAANMMRRSANAYEKEAQRAHEEEQRRIRFERDQQIGVLGDESEELGYRITHQGPQAERYALQRQNYRIEEKMRFENNPALKMQESVDADRLRLFDVEESDRRAKIKLGLDTTGEITKALLARDPTGAKVAGQVGSGIGEAKELSNRGYNDFAKQSLQNTFSQLDLTRQQYADQFHSVGLGKFDDITSPRDVEDPSQVLKEIADGQAKIVQAINALKSD